MLPTLALNIGHGQYYMLFILRIASRTTPLAPLPILPGQETNQVPNTGKYSVARSSSVYLVSAVPSWTRTQRLASFFIFDEAGMTVPPAYRTPAQRIFQDIGYSSQLK